jgi:hypothetical protein
MKITLPDGHKWAEIDSDYASETWFSCSCGATFTHDMIDNSQNFEDGDRSCDKYEGQDRENYTDTQDRKNYLTK